MNSKILAAVTATTAAVVIAGAVISSALIINNKSDYGNVYSQIVTKNPDFKKHKASEIIVGMIHESKANSVNGNIFLVPPTTDYKTAYMNAIASFETDNPSYGREWNKFHCVYADGCIDFDNVISGKNSEANSSDLREISVYKQGSKGADGKSESIYLEVNKMRFEGTSSVDKTYKFSSGLFGKKVYVFSVHTLDGRVSMHASEEVSNYNVDIDIKTCYDGTKKFEGLNKIYNLKTLKADIFNPKKDVVERYKQLRKTIGFNK